MLNSIPARKFVVLGLLAAASAFAQANKIIPHIVQAPDWSTWIQVINLCSEPSNYRMALKGADGERQPFVFPDGNLWSEAYNDDIAARETYWLSFPRDSVALAGYGEITEDGNGCIAFEVIYEQTFPDDDFWMERIVPGKRASAGATFSFYITSACDLSIALAGDGTPVSLEAADRSGEILASKSLGNVHYTRFMLKDKFPELAPVGDDNLAGTVKVGGNISVVGLRMCNGELWRAVHVHPLPAGAGGTTVTSRPGTSSSEYEVVEFAAKLIAIDTTGIAGHTYSYRLKLKNPSQVDHKYRVEVRFRDSDGFVVAWERVGVWDECYCVSAGQTRLFEGTFLNYFRADEWEYTVEAEITVLE